MSITSPDLLNAAERINKQLAPAVVKLALAQRDANRVAAATTIVGSLGSTGIDEADARRVLREILNG